MGRKKRWAKIKRCDCKVENNRKEGRKKKEGVYVYVCGSDSCGAYIFE